MLVNTSIFTLGSSLLKLPLNSLIHWYFAAELS